MTRFIGRYFWLLFGGGWLIVGGLILQSGIEETVRERRYAREGVLARGTVLAKSVEPATRENSGTRYIVDYRFATADSRVVRASSAVSVERWEALGQGAPISVTYLRSDPETNRVGEGGGMATTLLPIGMGLVFAAAGGGIALWGWHRLAHERRLFREGLATRATVIDVIQSSLRLNRVRQWNIRYAYRDHLGQTREGRSNPVPPEEAEEWHTGDTGTVRFDRANPQDSLWLGMSDAEDSGSAGAPNRPTAL